MPRPVPGVPRVLAGPAAGLANMAPPGRSRLPVRMLSTSTSQLASVPKAWVRGADAAVDRGRSAPRPAGGRGRGSSRPATPGDRLDGLGRERRDRGAHLVEAGDVLGRPCRGRRGPRRRARWPSPARRWASVPGRIGDPLRWPSRRCGCGAGRRRRASPPRSTRRSRRPGQSGAVARLPFDANGLAPRQSRKSVRSRSGTGTVNAAEHQPGRDLLRPLVDGAGREERRRAERLEQRPAVEHARRCCGRSGCRGRRPTASRPWRVDDAAAGRASTAAPRLVPRRLDELAVARAPAGGAAGRGPRGAA